MLVDARGGSLCLDGERFYDAIAHAIAEVAGQAIDPFGENSDNGVRNRYYRY
jgi:hypothetical protein